MPTISGDCTVATGGGRGGGWAGSRDEALPSPRGADILEWKVACPSQITSQLGPMYHRSGK